MIHCVKVCFSSVVKAFYKLHGCSESNLMLTKACNENSNNKKHFKIFKLFQELLVKKSAFSVYIFFILTSNTSNALFLRTPPFNGAYILINRS